ncbi:hypothetical protein [Clostridium transplantifaecale]|uniref:hypothetical protein n=1 Tax=Clostridium transplantifaecale TaxID=2479838 RepID=UPI000F6332A3|nr:hypothetical protein [Clostridium transplantifaecale]
MPAYFSMAVQRRTDKVTDDYVEQIYSAVIESGFPFKSGYWFHEDAGYDEIVAWNRKKLAQGFRLGFTEHVQNDYMQILFNAPAYKEMRGFWMYGKKEVAFDLIIPESDIMSHDKNHLERCTASEDKVSPIRAIGAAIWNRGLADVIQTNFELDGGYYSMGKVLGGEKLMAHPFAIIPEDIVVRFGEDYLTGKRITRIGNNGIIIDNDAYLSGRHTTDR